MELKITNQNYNCTIYKISSLIDLEGCDNVQGAIVSGYQVIVSKDVKINDIGLFFPAEVQLSEDFCKNNNLFRDSTLNKNNDKKGYIENNRRVKTMKFRGHKSEGLWMNLSALNYINIKNELKENNSFNEIIINKKVYDICNKYVIKQQNISLSKNEKRNKKLKKISRMIENQFRFHLDTLQIKKNSHLLNPDMFISITRKYHGTSWIVGNILTKKKLKLKDKIAKIFGFNIIETDYDYVYSSRTVIKNKNFKDTTNSFYDIDIWSDINNKIKELNIPKGITLYGEAVGYLPNSNKFIQKNYDYGCCDGQYKIIVYKMTFTNDEGNVFLIPFNQMVEFCTYRNLMTPDLFYYGKVKNLFDINYSNENWKNEWINLLYSKEEFGMNDINCPICKNKVPSEGVVIRREDTLDFNTITLKAKNFKFLEKETKDLDKGILDIESDS